jgi:L-alanine-DL-glutamate epimerase-like enolase superfamily enzyme
MKVYEVECLAVVTLAAQDMQKAALHGAAVIKDNKPIMKRSLIVLALWALTAYHSNATAANLLFGRIGATLKTSQLTTQVWVEKRADMVNLAATEAR